MKRLFLILMIFLGITGCDPLDETYEELDKVAQDPTAVQNVTLTLSEDEYELLEEYDVATFGNFNSEDEAKTYIPKILEQLYAHLGDGSSAVVTYEMYNPISINNTVAFTLTEDDYLAIDEPSGALSSTGDIEKAVAHKYPSPEDNDLITLNYDYYTGATTEARTSKITYIDGFWYIAYVLTPEDYTFLGQSFPNFDSRSLARERIAVLFNDLFRFAEEGDLKAAVFTYTYFDDKGTEDKEDDERVFEDFLAIFEFDGESWIPQQDVMPYTLQFGNEDGEWIPDNTIRYSLSASDHTAIGNAWTDGPAKTSILQYGNFDLSLWSNDDIATAIGNHLKNLFPGAEEGQKYLVTYLTYSGGAGSDEMLLILNSEGEYEIVE